MSNHAIARALSTSRPAVIGWQRYAQEGVQGLIPDRPRGLPFEALPKDKEAAIAAKTLHEKPVAATHWTCRGMAQVPGVSFVSVQRIWNAHGLKPHLARTFKPGNDPHFIRKKGVRPLFFFTKSGQVQPRLSPGGHPSPARGEGTTFNKPNFTCNSPALQAEEQGGGQVGKPEIKSVYPDTYQLNWVRNATAL